MARPAGRVSRLMSRLRLVAAGFLVILMGGVAAGAAGLCGGASCCASGEGDIRLEAPSCCDDECRTTTVSATDSDRSIRSTARPDLVLAAAPPMVLPTLETASLSRSPGFGLSPPPSDSPPSVPLRL
jgi:hypothetical protein